ncbi:MAG: RhuM family protein [Candidatus Cloacimonetes bacterium]|nr:RhuM family protein [Candidatus Cloacimonadota bacterium]
MKNEIIIYQNEDSSTKIEVRLEDETVWLTQSQMVELFQSTKQNVSLHINNIFRENELQENSVVKYSLTTASDGKKYQTKYYNLDVIISIGYRVKSQRGTQFRIWANQVLKDYLLKGYAVSHRVDRIENDMHSMKQELSEIKLQLNTSLPPDYGIFYEGQVFDAYVLACDIIKTAKKSIILIDNYIDESVLTLLTKRQKNVIATVYTKTISKQLELDINKHNQQYPAIEVRIFTKSHDRFLIIDNEIVYHIGASLKDLGKNWVAFSKMNLESFDMINKLGR